MDKVILVIDMPSKCSECPCFQYGVDNYCAVTGEVNYSHDNRKPDDCPLQPAPREQEIWYGDDSSDWDKGYNACLHEIVGD